MSQQLLLMDAIVRGSHEDVGEAIVTAKACVTDLHDHGLYLALRRSPFDIDVLETLLANGADPNVEISNIRWAFTKPLECSPNAEAMKMLIDHGAKVDDAAHLVANYTLSAFHTELNHGAKSAEDVDLLRRIHYLVAAGAPVSEEPVTALAPSPKFMLGELRKLYPWLGQ